MYLFKKIDFKDLLFSSLLIAAAVAISGLLPVIMSQGYILYPSAIFFGASALALYILMECIAGNMNRSHVPAIIVGVCFLFIIVMLVISIIVKDLIFWSLGASLIFLVMIIRFRFSLGGGILLDYFSLPAAIILSVVLNVFLPKEYGLIIDLVALAVVVVALAIVTYMIGLPYADEYFSHFKIENTKKRVLPTMRNPYENDDGNPYELEWLIGHESDAYKVEVEVYGNTIEIYAVISHVDHNKLSYTKGKISKICQQWGRKHRVSYKYKINVSID